MLTKTHRSVTTTVSLAKTTVTKRKFLETKIMETTDMPIYVCMCV